MAARRDRLRPGRRHLLGAERHARRRQHRLGLDALRRHLQPLRAHAAAVRHRGALRRPGPTRTTLARHVDDNTRLVFAETIGNPKLNVVDIHAWADAAHAQGLPLDRRQHRADADPRARALRPRRRHRGALGDEVHRRPRHLDRRRGRRLRASFDWAAHAERFPGLTKPDPSYHGVVWADALGPAAYIGRVRTVLLRNTGAALSPFNAFLFLQGIETLPLRMERHIARTRSPSRSTSRSTTPCRWVSYPGLESSPYKEVADRVLTGGYGGARHVRDQGRPRGGQAFIEALELFSHLANIGDAKSLAIHNATTTHSQLNAEELEAAGVTQDTVRLSRRHRARRRHPRGPRPGARKARVRHRLASRTTAVPDAASASSRRSGSSSSPRTTRWCSTSGATLAPVEVAYETYGTLDADRGNAVFVCHALTGDAHAAGHHGDPARPGWWDTPDRPGQAGRHRPASSSSAPNLLGGCQGTTGPASIDPRDRAAVRAATSRCSRVRDLVARAPPAARAPRHRRLHAAIGGSLGGMQVAAVGARPPGRDRGRACSSARRARLTAQNIAFSRRRPRGDHARPGLRRRRLHGTGARPDVGLAVARMMAHITYLSEESMRRKFDRARQDADAPPTASAPTSRSSTTSTTRAESSSHRFDAHTYLYLTRVMDYFDPFGDAGRDVGACAAVRTRFLRRLVRHRLALRHPALARASCEQLAAAACR